MRTETPVESAKSRLNERQRAAMAIDGRAATAGVFCLLFSICGISGLTQTGSLLAAALMPIIYVCARAASKRIKENIFSCTVSAAARIVSLAALARAFAEITGVCFYPVFSAEITAPIICLLAAWTSVIWGRGAGMACGFALVIYIVMLAAAFIECAPRFDFGVVAAAGFPKVPPLSGTALLLSSAPAFGLRKGAPRAGRALFGWGLFIIVNLAAAALLPLSGFMGAAVFSGAGDGIARAAMPCALGALIFCSAGSFAHSAALSAHRLLKKLPKIWAAAAVGILSAAISIFKEAIIVCAAILGALLLMSALISALTPASISAENRQ